MKFVQCDRWEQMIQCIYYFLCAAGITLSLESHLRKGNNLFLTILIKKTKNFINAKMKCEPIFLPFIIKPISMTFIQVLKHFFLNVLNKRRYNILRRPPAKMLIIIFCVVFSSFCVFLLWDIFFLQLLNYTDKDEKFIMCVYKPIGFQIKNSSINYAFD